MKIAKPNQYTTEGLVSFIHLNKDLKTTIDTKHLQAVIEHGRWGAIKPTKQSGYYVICKKTKKYLHRLILELEGIELKEHTDHRDHQPLNNTISNLRPCTRSENFQNKSTAKTSTSKYLGVCRRSDTTFQSMIKTNGKMVHLGMYKSEEEAALVYNMASMISFGQFSNPNKVDGKLDLEVAMDIIKRLYCSEQGIKYQSVKKNARIELLEPYSDTVEDELVEDRELLGIIFDSDKSREWLEVNIGKLNKAIRKYNKESVLLERDSELSWNPDMVAIEIKFEKGKDQWAQDQLWKVLNLVSKKNPIF